MKNKLHYKIISRFLLRKCKLGVPYLVGTYALTRFIYVFSILRKEEKQVAVKSLKLSYLTKTS